MANKRIRKKWSKRWGYKRCDRGKYWNQIQELHDKWVEMVWQDVFDDIQTWPIVTNERTTQ